MQSQRIAVLPLRNISPDPGDEYFVDGMTEELIFNLSKIAQLRVIARTSVMRFKTQAKSIAEIGNELGVTTVLEGSVRRAGDRIRIAVELVDVATQENLWSEQYQREFEDVFEIQSDIATRVASALKVEILQREKGEIEKKATGDVDAYREYLNGRFHWNLRTEAGLNQAVEHFTTAISLDPSYALAYSGVADSYAMLALSEFLPPREAFPRAKEAAEHALRLDANLAEAHTSLGLTRFQYDWNWRAAEAAFRRALELNPRYPVAHQFYADYLKAMGRFPEAIEHMRTALDLDPGSLAINTGLGHVLYLSRQYDEAILQYRKAVDMDPRFVLSHLWFGRPYLQKGMYAEALAEVNEAVRLSEQSTMALGVLGHVYASAGQRQEAEDLLRKLQERSSRTYVASYWIALINIGLDEKDHAFEWLERALQERSSWLVWSGVEPRFDSIRSDERFISLMGRLGLDSVEATGARDNLADAVTMLTATQRLRTSDFKVVGEYIRYDQATRNVLKDLKRKVLDGVRSSSSRRENFLIWAPPGSGKTYLVQQLAAAAGEEIDFVELNLAQVAEDGFRTALERGRQGSHPSIWLIDEIDSKEGTSWPYEALLTHLDGGEPQSGRRVFVIAGSSGSSLEKFTHILASRPKGSDMLSRIPNENQYTIPALTPEDRILVAVRTLQRAAAKAGSEILEVEKLALYFIATNPGLSSARQLREFALRCIERIPPSEDRVRFDNLFDPGDVKNKSFWLETNSHAPQLIDTFIRIEPS